MDLKFIACLIVLLGVCNGEGTWRETPTAGQYEAGDEVILTCALDNVSPAFLPGWSVLKEGDTTSTTISADGTNIAQEFTDKVEIVNNEDGQYNLKIKAVTFDDQGEYICQTIDADPQTQSANVGVWAPVKTLSLTGGDETVSVEVPKPGETFTYTRTCSASNVRPNPSVTWTYSITADNGLSVIGELPEDFVSGPLPDDGLIDDGTNNVEVATTTTDNGDGTSNVQSVLTVTYTTSADDDGTTAPNLKIVATCKTSQDALVASTLEIESNPLTVDVTARQITTQQPEPTGSPLKTTAPSTKGEKEPESKTEPTEKTKMSTKSPATTKEVSKAPLPKTTPKDASGKTDKVTNGGGCSSGCVAGIVIALLIIGVGVTVLVIFYMRKRNSPKKLENKDKSSKNKKDPPPVNV